MMWELGRQGGGYYKYKVFQTKWLDCFLVKFPNGSSINKHIDPCDYGKHYRINITLKNPEGGGIFLCKNGPIFKWQRIVIFRPDIQPHEVTPVVGDRLIISLGFIIPN